MDLRLFILNEVRRSQQNVSVTSLTHSHLLSLSLDLSPGWGRRAPTTTTTTMRPRRSRSGPAPSEGGQTQSQGAGARRTRDLRNRISFWKRKSASITDYDPQYRVTYLGNVLTGWAKGKELSFHSNFTIHEIVLKVLLRPPVSCRLRSPS